MKARTSTAMRVWVLLALCLVEAAIRAIREPVFHSFDISESTMPLVSLIVVEISVVTLFADQVIVLSAKGLAGLLGRLFPTPAR